MNTYVRPHTKRLTSLIHKSCKLHTGIECRVQNKSNLLGQMTFDKGAKEIQKGESLTNVVLELNMFMERNYPQSFPHIVHKN
jgi:hypothetical protein